jgi:YVTN family beta-propeller protein
MKLGKQYLQIAALIGLFATFDCITASAQSYAYVPDGGVNTLAVIDTGTNTVVTTIAMSSPLGVAVTPNGAFAYVTNFEGGSVSVIDRANTVVATVPGFSSPLFVAVTPNGAFVYVANFANDTVGVINTATNTLATTIPLPAGSQPTGVAITPNGASVYVTDQGTNTVSVISTATNRVTATVPVGANPAYPAVTPNGAFVYVSNFGGATVSEISTATNTVVATIPVGNRPLGIGIRPDGAVAYLANRDDNTVYAINTATNAVIAQVPVGHGPNGVAITSDGAFAYVVNQFDATVSVIETGSNTVIATISAGGLGNPQEIAITPGENDSQYAQLNGGNSFNGNQVVNGAVSAASFVGNGSGLTGVTSSNLNCTGCVGNTQLGINYAVGDAQSGNALNALRLGGLLPTAFATLGANIFTGNQSMPTLSTTGAVTIGGGTPIAKHLSLTFSLNISSLRPSTCTSTSFTFAGASDGDTTALGVPNALMTPGMIIYSAWVTTANLVTIRACNVNPNGPATTAASGTVRFDVWKH